jgi:hypothetical protein
MRGFLVLLLLGAAAPWQCSSERDPALATEDTPEEAIYLLAQRFRDKGDERAWRATLEYLVERYPSSRYAARAKSDLEAGRDKVSD